MLWLTWLIQHLLLSASMERTSGGHLTRLECTWSGDGKAYQNEDKYGVSKVQFHCASGFVQWTNPYGGLRIEFLAPIERPESEFTVCFLSASPGATIYHENATGIQIVKPYDWFDPNKPICLDSASGQAVALFDVAEKGRSHLRIDYELEMNLLEADLHKDFACKECNLQILSERLCSSDFAAEALIEDIYLHSEETHLQLNLLVTKLFGTTTSNIFKKSGRNSYYEGTVATKSRCDVRPNQRYLFLGSIRKEIGAEVDCHVALHKWKHLKNRIKKCDSGSEDIVPPN